MGEKMNRRGQISAWVIITLVIIGTVAVFFAVKKDIILGKAKPFTPEGYLDKCVREGVNEAVDIMLPRGGFINNKLNVKFNNLNVSYLCYNRGNYLPCINQHPMLITEMEKEMENYLNPVVDECVESLKEEVKERGGVIDVGDLNFDVVLAPERIFVELDGDMQIEMNNAVSVYEKFRIEVLSPLYNLGFVAMEIASQEAKYCYFSYEGYMILYQRFDIRRNRLSDSNLVYSIKDEKTAKTMNIAIRGCAIPAGI